MSCDDAGDEILGRLAVCDVHLPGFGLVALGPQRVGEGLGLGEVAPTTTTLAPAAARFSAIAAPIPEAPPVTIATLSCMPTPLLMAQ